MKDDYILIKTQSYIEKLPTEEVISVQRDGRRIHIAADNKEYVYYEKMDNVSPHLDERFYRCHGGCYINFDKVRLMEDQEIMFYNGQTLFLGRTNFIKTKQHFYRYNLKND